MSNKITIEAAIIEANRAANPDVRPTDYDRRAACMDVLITAARYRVLRKPINPKYGNILCDCPNCFSSVTYATDLFCRKCGQALDWSEE